MTDKHHPAAEFGRFVADKHQPAAAFGRFIADKHHPAAVFGRLNAYIGSPARLRTNIPPLKGLFTFVFAQFTLLSIAASACHYYLKQDSLKQPHTKTGEIVCTNIKNH
jgi:hypothetical protein